MLTFKLLLTVWVPNVKDREISTGTSHGKLQALFPLGLFIDSQMKCVGFLLSSHVTLWHGQPFTLYNKWKIFAFFFNATMISALKIPTKKKETAVKLFILSVYQKLLAQYEDTALVWRCCPVALLSLMITDSRQLLKEREIEYLGLNSRNTVSLTDRLI